VPSEPKDERFHLRISNDEREMLRLLAEAAGESEATIVRRLIREAYAKGPGAKRKRK
jgi:uncharacterized protein (DUF1778 family)